MRNDVVLVAGMHRSGTSALTRVCNLLGANLPEPLVSPATGNELGHWEPQAVVDINNRALMAMGSDVNAVAPLHPDWRSSPAAEALGHEIAEFLHHLPLAEAPWLVKDPRISVLAPAWRDTLLSEGVIPRFLIVLRNPLEIAVSLSKRQLHHFPNQPWPIERGLILYLKHVLTVERASRGFPRSFCDYDDLIADWRGQVGRIYSQLELNLPEMHLSQADQIDAFLDSGHRHSIADIAACPIAMAREAHTLLLGRIADPMGGASVLDDLSKRFETGFDLLGGYVDVLENRVASIPESIETVTRLNVEAERIQLASELAAVRSDLDRLLSSRIWRLTAPLRAVASSLKGR